MANPAPKTFVVSDESKNSYNFRVLTAGIDTTAFEQNPVMLYMHRRGKVFGGWVGLTKQDGQMLATPEFDTEDTDEQVQSIAGKVARGILKAASIGIEIIEIIYNEALSCYDILRCTLVEISIVDIPSNSNAIALYRAGSDEPMSYAELSTELQRVKPTDLPPPTTNQTMSQFKTLAVAAGLPETATETEISAAILTLNANKGYKDKYDELLKKQEKDQLQLATGLVDGAIADGRIPATMKDTYLTLFKSNHDGTAAILAAMPKPTNLVTFAANGGAAASAAAGNFLALSGEEAIKEFDRQDRAGTLLKLKNENKPAFDHLFEQKYGQKPTQ